GDEQRPRRRHLVHGGLHLRPRPGRPGGARGAHARGLPVDRREPPVLRDPSAVDRRQGRPGPPRLHSRAGPRGPRRAARPRRPLSARSERGRARPAARGAAAAAGGQGVVAAEAGLRDRSRGVASRGRPASHRSLPRDRHGSVRRPRRDRRDRARRDRRADADPRRRERAALEPGLLPARGRGVVQHAALREQVLEANLALVRAGLVVLTFGNASAVDRSAGVVAIKPSGVSYDGLAVEDVTLVELATGAVLDSATRPSSDTPTHLALYRAWSEVGGIVHTHSAFATAWAQAAREIPCLGTTHADHFNGAVPVTRALTHREIEGDYERATGDVIVETFAELALEPLERPAVLVASHGPFSWAACVEQAVENRSEERRV